MVRQPVRGAIEEPFDRLYRAESDRLWRALVAFSGDAELASDAVAEAFAQCIRRGVEVRDPRAWLWRAAFAIARGALKERSRWRTLSDLREEPTQDEGLARLLDALARLPERQRAVVLLRHYAGYRPSEVARMLGIAPATVRVHLARARRALKRLLEEERR
jgi:RNA polymerase sigma factor (sigma-70 family)